MSLEPEKLKEDFPVFEEHPGLAYLDNAATSQKPRQVIDRIEKFYSEENSNVGRGIYELAGDATKAYSNARKTIAEFLGAGSEEIVFVRGCTEAINLLAASLPSEGNVAVPVSAHHSEMLPWRKHFGEQNIRYLPVENGRIDVEKARQIIDGEVTVVSVSHVSNVYGTEAPVEELVEIAHENDAYLVLDAAQSVPHRPVNFEELGVDFAAFSGHKMLGPTGIGVLYGKKSLLRRLEPYQVGGGMVRKVSRTGAEYESAPKRFEAGTPNVAGAVGMAEAARYLEDAGRENIEKHVKMLCKAAREGLSEIEGVRVLGQKDSSILSFTVDWAHPHDVAEMLNQEDIAVRAGHHCAQPGMEAEDLSSGTIRASPYLYNTRGDVERLVKAVEKAREVFK